MINGDVSWWWNDVGGGPAARPALIGHRKADVCIIGAGYTGLWTAFYLKQIRPELEVVILEANFAGYGASGRNGGWLTAALPGSRAVLARESRGADGVRDLERQLQLQVDEVIAVAAEHGIDADIVKSGELRVATSDAQLQRLRAAYAADQEWDSNQDRWLSPAQVTERVAIAGARAAIWSPHCARIHPVKLVQSLAKLVEQQGVSILEHSPATDITSGLVHTAAGVLEAKSVLRCTEGFTSQLPGERRTWLPMNSSMIATEPLTDAQWADIGWSGAEVIGDEAHAYIYAQRTASGRIAIGGRGKPYRFGSRIDVDGQTPPETVEALTHALHTLLPATRGTPIAHAWSGVLGVPRDWSATVSFDAATGVGFAGGYVGHGVTASSLAGRTLAELTLGLSTERTRLPWANRAVRTWEPEPFRWLGVQGLYAGYRYADRREATLGRTSVVARAANLISRKP